MPATVDGLRYDIESLTKSGAFGEIVDRCHVELTMARREGNHSLEIIALLGLAQAQCSLGHFDFARDYINQAVDGANAIRSVGLMIDALLARARIAREGYLQTGDALEDYRKAVDYAFEAGDMRRYALSILGMGEIASDANESSKQAWKAIDIAREINDDQLEAQAILLLSNAFIRKNEHSKANDGLLVALRKAQAVKDRLLESVIIGQQGLVLAQDADSFERGLEQQLTALEVARGLEAVFHEFMRLYTLAMTLVAANDLAEARGYFDQMLALAQDIKHPPYEMYTLGMIGQWQELRANHDSAISYYGRAVDMARAVGNPQSEARYLYALGSVYTSQWEFSAARQEYSRARAIYQSLDDGRNATRVRASIVYTYIMAVATRILRLLGAQPAGE